MAYDSALQMIFIDMSTNPDEGVSIEDIKTALSSQENYIGRLITEGNINPWALYKPVSESDKGMIVRGNLKRLGFGPVSRSDTSLPHAQTVQQLIDLYTDGETNSLAGRPANGWRYHKPRGRTYDEWFRFFDFVKIVSESNSTHPVTDIGYHHLARNPFGKFDCVTNVSKNGGAFTASNSTTIPQTGIPEYDIAVYDFYTLMASAYKMRYYGVMLVPVSGQQDATTTYIIFNNDETIFDVEEGEDYIRGQESQSGMALEQFAMPEGMHVGEYTAYPFLSNVPLDQNLRYLVKLANERTQYITADHPWLYPMPGSTPLVVNVYDTEVIINVYAVGSAVYTPGSGYTGSIYITIRNNSSSAVNIPRLELQFRTSDCAFSDARRTGEVFYDGQYRIDDDYPGGRSDTSYSSFLRPSGGYDIPGNGGEIRIPAGAGLTNVVNIPGLQTPFLIIGDPAHTRVYGTTIFRFPVVRETEPVVQP